MKPEELMIGDWVSLFQGNPDLSSCNVQVTFIGEYGEVGIEGCEEYTSANCNLLFPIPLTPKILEKNGFIGDKNVCKTKVRDDSKDELWQCEYAWYLKNLRIKNRTNGSVARLYNIMFVHELQHALRLCGINKVIEI